MVTILRQNLTGGQRDFAVRPLDNNTSPTSGTAELKSGLPSGDAVSEFRQSENHPNKLHQFSAGENSGAWLGEFHQSAIPDRLTLANIQWFEGDAAIEVMTAEAIAHVQKSTSFVGTQAANILKRHEWAAAGGWCGWGTTIGGGVGAVPYFKPVTPPIDFEKRKPIKYPTPQGTQALPLLPWVDAETARAIYDRYKLTPQDGETYWQVIRRANVPIAVTEGLKKALALIAHGIPAIAIRGIAQWHIKGSNQLHQAIDDFATIGRRIYICFDQDAKTRTQADVRQQTLKLGAALAALRCKPAVMLWNRETGKGIDDALYALGDGAQTWLDAVVDDAPDLDTYKRDSRVLQALTNLKRFNTLSYPIERATRGEYLPQLPELQTGAIHVLSATMNAGKTTRIGADWKQQAHNHGWNVLVLTPINNLGKQAGFDWGLPHIHNYATDRDSQTALWSEVSAAHGLVMCAESLHRIPDSFWQRPTLLILDEANQVIESLTQGDTLGSRYSLILEEFTAAARHAIATGAIVLSEDGLPDRAVKFAKAVSGAAAVRVFTHRKESNPWDCTVYRGQASGYRAAFLQAVRSGKRLVYVASSQRETKRMDRAIVKLAPGRKVVRIDSKTNQQGQFTEFFEQPDRWIQDNQPDILILSPSAKSGVSIEGGVDAENAYFSAVWGYFPALGTDTHMQQLGRYRPAVPRIVFCPDFILSNGDESLLSPRAIRRRLGLNAKAVIGVYGLSELLEAGDDEQAELMGTIQTAVMDYLAAAKATIGNQKLIAHIALVERLKAAGHNVTTAQAEKDKGTVAQWAAINEEIWREEAAAISQGEIIAGKHTIEWARKALDSADVGIETRLLAQKVIYRSEFPGVMFDCPEECYVALTRDYGVMRRGVLLQAKADNLDGTKIDDTAAAKAILSGNIKALHRLPRNYVQALMVSQSGVLDLLDGSIYSNADARCQRVKDWALRFSKEISYWLRLQINDQQSSIEICHKLLKKFDLERDKADRPGAIAMVGRKGKRGANSERFRVNLDYCPVRARLLEAARRRLSEFVTSTRNREISSLRIDVTEAQTPTNAKEQAPIPPPPQEIERTKPEPDPGFDPYGHLIDDFAA
jgi:Domain of unknown function (DUF3854)